MNRLLKHREWSYEKTADIVRTKGISDTFRQYHMLEMAMIFWKCGILDLKNNQLLLHRMPNLYLFPWHVKKLTEYLYWHLDEQRYTVLDYVDYIAGVQRNETGGCISLSHEMAIRTGIEHIVICDEHPLMGPFVSANYGNHFIKEHRPHIILTLDYVGANVNDAPTHGFSLHKLRNFEGELGDKYDSSMETICLIDGTGLRRPVYDEGELINHNETSNIISICTEREFMDFCYKHRRMVKINADKHLKHGRYHLSQDYIKKWRPKWHKQWKEEDEKARLERFRALSDSRASYISQATK